MDNIQNEINDYLSSAYDQVEQIALQKTNVELREKYPNGYNNEIRSSLMQKNREIARNEILARMKYEQEYKNLMHKATIEEEQRYLDMQQAKIRESQMNDEWWLKKQQTRAEEKIITDDLNGINVNNIVEQYKDIANYFNVCDTIELSKIIERAQNGNFDIKALEKIIVTPEGKARLREITTQNNDTIDYNDFLKKVSDSVKRLASQRLMTSDGYMDIAKKDIETRTTAVSQKMNALSDIRKASKVNDNSYSTAINELNDSVQRVSSDSFSHNFAVARDNQRQQDKILREQQLSVQNDLKNVEDASLGGISRK